MCPADRTSSRKITASKLTHGHLCNGLAYQILFDFDASLQAFTVEQYLAHVGARILKRKIKIKIFNFLQKISKKIFKI